MKTAASSNHERSGSLPSVTAGAVRLCRWLLPTLVIMAQAQDFSYSTDHGTITITGYTGLGGIVTIPGAINGLPVTSIRANAFKGRGSFTSVVIPSSVTNIGYAPFIGCTNLSEITVDVLNAFYRSVDGVLFDKSQTTLIQYPVARTGSFTIPDGVRTIGKQAFYGSLGLTRLAMPDSVRVIEDGAFANCIGLNEATIGKGVVVMRAQAFMNCGRLKGAYFRGDAPTLGSAVFDGDSYATAYYTRGTTGWELGHDEGFAGLRTVLAHTENRWF